MIPKKLHFTYASKDLPAKYQDNLKAWRKMCPDWELRLFCDEDIYQLFEDHFPQYFEILPKIPYGAMLADFFRYAILFVEGGLYSDIDTIPLKPIPDEWLNFEAVLGYEYQPSKFPDSFRYPWKEKEFLCQWTLLSKPSCFLFKEALEEAFRRLEKLEFHAKNVFDGLHTAGPLLLTDVVQSYKRRNELLILDADYFGCRVEQHFPFTERSIVQHQYDGVEGWKVQVKMPHLKLG